MLYTTAAAVLALVGAGVSGQQVGLLDPSQIPMDIYAVPRQPHCQSIVPRVPTCAPGQKPAFVETSRIAILGAGPGGISMAHYLSKLGYNNVRILERSNRIGGLTNTRYTDGIPHELGTTYTAGRYDCILRLMEETFIKRVPTPGLGFVADSTLNGTFPTLEWTMRAWAQLTNSPPDPAKFLDLLKEQLTRYAVMYKQFFGDSGYLFPPRPTPEVLSNLGGVTFRQFLEQNNMPALVALMVIMQSSNGFGFLDEIPAFYGFLWSTPSVFLSIIAPNVNNTVSMVQDGWIQLWNRLSRGKDIVLNADVTRITRSTRTGVTINYNTPAGGPQVEKFDFLITFSKWPESLKIVDVRRLEKDILSRPKFAKFHAVMFQAANINREYQVLFADQLVHSVKGEPHLCYTRRDLGNLYPNLTEPRDIFIGGQQVGFDYNDAMTTDILDSTLQADLAKMGARDVQILERFSPPYFPRLRGAEIAAGYPWRLWDLQGTYQTWYAGSNGAHLESTADVIDYNYRLLENKLCRLPATPAPAPGQYSPFYNPNNGNANNGKIGYGEPY